MTIELNEARQLFKDQLSGKEQILWASRSTQGIQFRNSDKYMIPFSLLWCTTVGILAWFTLSMGGIGTTMAWFIAPFMLVGLYLLLGRFFMDAFIRKHIFYALSSKKLLVRTGKWNRSTNTFPLKSIHKIALEKGKKGNGTLRCYDANNVLLLQMDMLTDIQQLADTIEEAKSSEYPPKLKPTSA